jgi:hypothetical protein
MSSVQSDAGLKQTRAFNATSDMIPDCPAAEVCIGGSRFIYNPSMALTYTAAQSYCSKTYGGSNPRSAHLAYLTSELEQGALLGWIGSLKLATAKVQYDSTNTRVASSTATSYYGTGAHGLLHHLAHHLHSMHASGC